MKAFISYSHSDEAALERLLKHLSVLRDEGAIDDWYDREILPGQDFDDEILAKLEECQLFLPLISPDFLASDYCRNREMKRALERHDAGDVTIVPLIIEPCDWEHSPLGRLKALPKDATAVSEWDNENSAYKDIAKGLRKLLSGLGEDTATAPPAVRSSPRPRPAAPFRVRRDFDQIERSDFRDQSFDKIKSHFGTLVVQIDSVDGLRGRLKDLGPTSFSCTVINQSKDRCEAHITVHCGNQSIGFGDITYSYSPDAPANTANGWITVESDEYELRLKLNDFGDMGEDMFVSAQSAAEILWKRFSSRAGLDYD